MAGEPRSATTRASSTRSRAGPATSAQNLSPHAKMIEHFGSHLAKLKACFREGGGIPYSAYRPVFTQCMDDLWRRIYDQMLVPGFIGAVPGLGGYDIGEDAIADARKEATEMGLRNAGFQVRGVAELPAQPKFADGGTFLMVDFKLSSRLEGNLANPCAALYYGTSLMHCMPVSLAVGGKGLVLDTPRPQNCMLVCRA